MLWKLLRQKLLNRTEKSFLNPELLSIKVKAQEAHEAIRPTDMSRHTVNIDRDQARLYDLIWKRTLASQMSDAKLERTNVKIEANNHSEILRLQVRCCF
jgi:DNA topoisomerase-1